MFFKFLTISLLLFYAYRIFVRPFLQLPNKEKFEQEQPIDDGDYIEYEEVD